jgi:SAM-dependent methyltransferase
LTERSLLDRLPLGDTLDVRPASEFQVGHFASAFSCPLDTLGSSSHLLPPRERALWVFGDDREAAAALELLRARGFGRAELHPAMAPGAAPARPVESPWVGGEARVRLWEPAPFVAEVLSDAEAPGKGRAADIACGSGRDATYLALAGFETSGVDILADALDKARELAETARRAAPTLEVPLWLRADLETAWPFRDAALDLVVCVRFLWRPLLPALAAALRPGGSLVYETFTVRQRWHGKPCHPDHLVEPGELRERFTALGLEIVRYREQDPEAGPSLASLWARRPERSDH